MITKLILENFTAFKNLSVDFSSKINVIIGENGTGKTHLLKVAYTLCSGSNPLESQRNVTKDDISKSITSKLVGVFMPQGNNLAKIHRNGVRKDAKVEAEFVDRKIQFTFPGKKNSIAISNNIEYEKYSWEPVFIPAKEVLTLLEAFSDLSSNKDTLRLMFDHSYFDLCASVLKEASVQTEDSKQRWLYEECVNAIQGLFSLEDNKMSFKPGIYEMYKPPKAGKDTYFKPIGKNSFSPQMIAEGFRKFGVVQALLANGSLIPGVSGTLFWDEPEANMNPKLMGLLVKILLKMSRNGQQIILATHDYVILKWFDLLKDAGKEDHVRFHVLYSDEESGEIKIKSTDDYLEIEPNAIDEAFGFLIDQEIKNEMGGLGR